MAMAERPQEKKHQLDAIKDVLARSAEVKFAYIFGSCARGDTGPLSDVDVAVFLDSRVDPFAFRLRLMETLSRALRTEHLDLVILNDASPVLRYEVVREGRVIKEDKAARVEFETRALAEYLDTAHMRNVQRKYLKEQLGGSLGQ
jgi:predicted nucleotidyltransferase